MPRAIQLDRWLLLRAIKVENEFADAVLAAEFSVIELAIFQAIPQYGFGNCQIAAERTPLVFFMG